MAMVDQVEQYHMDFQDKESKIEEIIQKFWSTISTLVTGEEHEDLHLRMLIDRVKFNNENKAKKMKKKINKALQLNIFT